MQKITRINFGSAVMVDGVTSMSASEKTAEILYDEREQKYLITGIKNKQVVWVHATNVQWSTPDTSENAPKADRGPGRPRTTTP